MGTMQVTTKKEQLKVEVKLFVRQVQSLRQANEIT
jgi:hypothetical protein